MNIKFIEIRRHPEINLNWFGDAFKNESKRNKTVHIFQIYEYTHSRNPIHTQNHGQQWK